MIPSDGAEDGEDVQNVAVYSKRPGFSLPLMANNFRRFNARIGVVFVFQAQAERVFAWAKPTHTLSFLFVYSFVCLDPYLLVILPIMIFLLFIMVPAFLARHPPPPTGSKTNTTPYYSYQGPALAPAKTIKPASETSKDFLRNMGDLQNVMADFSDVHDATISIFAPITNFSNETLSSATFLLCTILAAALFLTAHLVPWRFIFLFGGNAAIISKHPRFWSFVQTLLRDLAEDDEESLDVPGDHKEKEAVDVLGLSVPSSPSATMALLEKVANISLDSYPEEREVEVFELQHRSPETYSSSSALWEHFLFSPMPYDPLSPARIAGDRPRGCRFFEDVQPPPGWGWKGKKWELDIDCREWVVERIITGVGCEVQGSTAEPNGTAGDEVGGWVWDLPPASSGSHETSREEDEIPTTLVYGDLSDSYNSLKKNGKSPKGKRRIPSYSASRDWEEGTGTVGPRAMGEWRRRRWVRVVHRISIADENPKSGR
ncbi:hypothetical protein ASPZODRAFT_1279613 [Penicilliopsis zonata CBS 506.65]|uniref:TECPR1-like DysF domain-containing protein n=1 Tax=Penicilliopsis zonata CBS 506.65 TaxID=1073090 RepID=A0A1L9S6U8_9EURO|nr:hypothetical protein ASPZODRAFT_1279613 [Penicilliopsis zonata CBS 506.65]OJJ42873.1 hypothetical protein ASPZODRAFT_1279613 [Penicilliopsis zonata CBS 506.65]